MTTKLKNASTRRAELKHLEAHEKLAETIAREFDKRVTVKVGPVVARNRGASFNVTGAVSGAIVAFDVVLGPGARNRDCWSTWVVVFDMAGLRVKADADYQALVFAECDLEPTG